MPPKESKESIALSSSSSSSSSSTTTSSEKQSASQQNAIKILNKMEYLKGGKWEIARNEKNEVLIIVEFKIIPSKERMIVANVEQIAIGMNAGIRSLNVKKQIAALATETASTMFKEVSIIQLENDDSNIFLSLFWNNSYSSDDFEILVTSVNKYSWLYQSAADARNIKSLVSSYLEKSEVDEQLQAVSKLKEHLDSRASETDFLREPIKRSENGTFSVNMLRSVLYGPCLEYEEIKYITHAHFLNEPLIDKDNVSKEIKSMFSGYSDFCDPPYFWIAADDKQLRSLAVFEQIIPHLGRYLERMGPPRIGELEVTWRVIATKKYDYLALRLSISAPFHSLGLNFYQRMREMSSTINYGNAGVVFQIDNTLVIYKWEKEIYFCLPPCSILVPWVVNCIKTTDSNENVVVDCSKLEEALKDFFGNTLKRVTEAVYLAYQENIAAKTMYGMMNEELFSCSAEAKNHTDIATTVTSYFSFWHPAEAREPLVHLLIPTPISTNTNKTVGIKPPHIS